MNPIKHTPLYSPAQILDARFTTLNGWQTPQGFDDLEVELSAARRDVALADSSARGKIQVEGVAASQMASALWNVPDLAVGQGADIAAGQLFRLRADRYFINTSPGGEEAALQSLTIASQSADSLITVTDLTHGRSELYLLGPSSPDLLSRLCGLDFYPPVFPNLTAKSSSVAKTTQLIIRRDLAGRPGFALIGAASLGGYLWETVIRAGRDLGVRPIGLAALNDLAAGK